MTIDSKPLAENSEVEVIPGLTPPPHAVLASDFHFSQLLVEVHLNRGNILKALLISFDRDNEQIILKDEATGYDKSLTFKEIQYFKLTKPYDIEQISINEGKKYVKFDADQFIRPYKIKFHDGLTLSGITLGYRLEKNGIHFYSRDPENVSRYFHLYVPKSAIAEYVINKKLGQFLVDEKIIKKKSLDLALEEQKNKRKSKIGEYLVSQNIVNSADLKNALERQKHMPNMRLGEILVNEKLISRSQLESALKKHIKDATQPLGELLISKGMLTRDQLQKSMAKKHGTPLVNLKDFVVDSDILSQLSAEVLNKYHVFPLYEYEGSLVVAMENPLDLEVQEVLRFISGKNIDPVMASAEDITWALEFYLSSTAYTGDQDFFNDLDDENLPIEEVTGEDDSTISSNIIVRIVNKIILDAYAQKASDIHIEPDISNNVVRVRFRKDGALMSYHDFPMRYRSEIISRVKVMCNLDVTQRNKPQDGKIAFKHISGPEFELRVATLPTTGGQEDVVMRLLHSGTIIPITDIGLNRRDEDCILELSARPHGLFLVCGPTGSGKTTTLHSILNHLNTTEKKIWTAEDPVEITQAGLRQVPVNQKLGLTFAKVLRAFLRADPDIIMIGEIRDGETANIAIESSLTGHLVLSTLHTNSAAETVIRLLEMEMDEFNLADALLGVLSQRLLKTLCSSCKTTYEPGEEELKQLALEYCRESTTQKYLAEEDIQKQLETWRKDAFNGGPITLYRSVGCKECFDSGYRGRVGVYELLVGSLPMKKLIMRKAPSNELLITALEEGMTTIKQDGILKVIQGYTDFAHVRIL